MKDGIRRVLCLALCVILVVLAVPTGEVRAAELDAGLYDQMDIGDFYGRNALKTLDNGAVLVYAYDRLLEGINLAEPSIKVYDGTNPISKEELYIVMDALTRDLMGDFWYDGTYSMSYNNKTIINVMPVYNMKGAALKDAVAAFRSAAEGILAGVKSGMTDYEKSLYLHDRVAGLVEYSGGANAHNAYGALVEGVAVCDGYTEAYGYLLQRCGIQSFVAKGTSENPVTHQPEAHAWNFVRIDGHYHQTDVTWDDQQDELFHMYFNEGDAVMLKDHTLSSAAYPLPSCCDCDRFYFTGKAELLNSYTVESVAALLKNNGYKDHVFVPGDVGVFIQWFSDNILDIAKAMGISGAFSYKYIQLGNELHLEIIVPGGPPAPVGVTLSGVIHSPGQDDSAVTVELCMNGQTVASVTVYGQNPAYVFENVKSGEYTLRIIRDGYITSELPVAVGTGSLTVETDIYRKGDVNGDGKVNNKDVIALMQNMSGWVVELMNGTQDVNRDGKVNNKDVIALMQYLAGWNVKVYE